MLKVQIAYNTNGKPYCTTLECVNVDGAIHVLKTLIFRKQRISVDEFFSTSVKSLLPNIA